MARKKTFITVTDQFCGAGGSSLGATAAGAELKLALNHWQLAIETHNTNFPQALHDCTDISACDPRRYPSTDILITSPECTNHSLANGKRKPTRQLSIFDGGKIDPAEERSRATMWDVPRFAEYHGYRIIIVENVVDARKWVMWDAWLHAMDLLGYDHRCVYLNSMHCHPTPQSRDRMYVVFWKRGNKRPNLNITAKAHCVKCAHDVDAIQSWKPGRSFGRYRKQYAYCCPKCGTVVEPYYHAAFNAIDWSLPAPRIGDREKPLKDATLRRIRVGLEKFGRPDPAVIDLRGDWQVRGTEEALSTLVATCTQHYLLTRPFLMETQFTHSPGDRTTGIEQAMPTQTGQQSRALVVPPFITSYYGNGGNALVTDALPTVVTRDHHAVVVPPFILSSYTRVSGQKAAVSSVNEPLPTVPGRAVHYVVQPQPFIMNAQSDNSPTWLHDPLRTLLTGNHKWLVDPPADMRIEDCGFRMLEPHECQTAMAFPDSYRVVGNKRERIKQLGNAVTPPAMHVLMQRCMETFR